MRCRTPSISALAALGALTLACSGAEPEPTGPTAGAAPALDQPEFSLYAVGRSQAAHGCNAPTYHQFDFWLGSWQVAGNGNPPVNASFITSDLDGCAIIENWRSPGSSARSLSSYDASDGRWHQHYVENYGFFPLRIDGGLQGDAMVMQGSYPDPYGTTKVFTDRYTWTALGPDDVRQAAEQSLDGGQTFGPIIFDGRYHRTSAPVVPTPPYYGTCESSDPSLALFREFDYLVGEWRVRVEGPGSVHGAAHQDPLVSTISREMDSCLLQERLTGRGGYEALVFLNIRPLDEIWQRTYLDNRGLRIFLTGPRAQGGLTVLTGSLPTGGHGTEPVRATFEQADADHFVERWERGDRDGSWTLFLTAAYERR